LRLVEGPGGELVKTGYAPLLEAGLVVALVAAEGTAPSFATLRDFRALLLLLALGGAVLGAVAAVVAAHSVTRPLHALAGAARRMGAGDLDSPLPEVGARGEVATLRRTLEETRLALRARDRERELMLAGIAHEVRNPLGAGAYAEVDLAGQPEALRGAAAGSFRPPTWWRRPSPAPGRRIRGGGRARWPRRWRFCRPYAPGVALAPSGRHLPGRPPPAPAGGANLVRNAGRTRGAEVALAVEAPAGAAEATLRVSDRGPGLPTEVRARLFEPITTTRERGTGLGLALARKVALAHGGRLAVEDRPGGGTVALLALPSGPAAPRPPPAAAQGKVEP
jgi:signal transduction histidine kinase